MGWIAYELERMGLFTFRQPIVFRKANPLPSFKENGFRSCMETGIWLVKDGGQFHRPRTFNFLGQDKMTSIWPYKIGIEGGKESKHPTEKPLGLTGRLVRIFSNPGDIVLDCFAGSGTTGIAAFKLGRNAISIERETDFIAMIKERQAKAEREKRG